MTKISTLDELKNDFPYPYPDPGKHRARCGEVDEKRCCQVQVFHIDSLLPEGTPIGIRYAAHKDALEFARWLDGIG